MGCCSDVAIVAPVSLNVSMTCCVEAVKLMLFGFETDVSPIFCIDPVGYIWDTYVPDDIRGGNISLISFGRQIPFELEKKN